MYGTTAGDPAMVQYISSYLFDKSTHLNDLYDRKEDSTSQFWTLPFVPGPTLAAWHGLNALSGRAPQVTDSLHVIGGVVVGHGCFRSRNENAFFRASVRDTIYRWT
jgi:hypothetical protein